MAEGELADITDINSSAAFVALDELVKDGSLTTAQVGWFTYVLSAMACFSLVCYVLVCWRLATTLA